MSKKEKIKIKARKLFTFYRQIIKNKSDFSVPFHKRIYWNLKGFTTDQIVLFNLNKNNYKNYITEIDRWETRYINKDFKEILDNKLLFYNYFKKDFEIPKVLCYISESKFFSLNGDVLSEESILKIVREEKKFLIKPLNAGGGVGIHLIEYSDENIYFDSKIIEASKLINSLLKYNNYIVSKYIFQNKYASDIFTNSVNTIRMISFYDKESDKIEIANATHRFGSSKNSIVDNVSSGGLFADICLKTGILSYAYSYNSLDKIYTHPVTNKQIEGLKVPSWTKIKKFIKSKAKKYPYLPYMAWDITLDENENIIVIEINASSGLTLIQMYKGYKNTALGRFFESENTY